MIISDSNTDNNDNGNNTKNNDGIELIIRI